MADNVQIQLGLLPETVNLIKALTDKTNTSDPADTISSSVKLASKLINEVQNGAKIFIEKNGVRQELKITGLN